MKSIFRYPGGKTKKNVKQKIISKFPYFKEYREPFVGGGGIFFDIPKEKIRWINDVNQDLISVYRALKYRPNDFISKCRAIEPEKEDEPKAKTVRGKELYNARLKAEFDKLVLNRNDSALSYYFINRTVWAGRVNYSVPSRLYYSNPSGWNITTSGVLEEAAEVIKDVTVTHGDYSSLLFAYGEDVLIYCDPPYYIKSNNIKTDKLYEYCFEEQDHIELCDVIKRTKHKVCISYNDDPFIRELYKDFTIHSETWAYCGSSQKVKKTGEELIITNY